MLGYYFTYKLVYVAFWISIPLYIFYLCLGELLDIFHLSSLRSWHFFMNLLLSYFVCLIASLSEF